MLKNTYTTYGGMIKFLHWVMAILFIGMFGVAYTMTNMPRTPVRFVLYDIHKATGLLLFGFFTFRLVWRLMNVQPAAPASLPHWQKKAAEWNIFALYLIMFLMPVTGFFMSILGGHAVTFYWIFTISPFAEDKAASAFFAQAHEWISYGMIFFVSVHFLAALYHHYIRKDAVLRRMLPS